MVTMIDSDEPYGHIDGDPAVCDPCPEAWQAYWLLKSLSERQRGLVLCWFCSSCHRFVPPGDYCTCARDE